MTSTPPHVPPPLPMRPRAIATLNTSEGSEFSKDLMPTQIQAQTQTPTPLLSSKGANTTTMRALPTQDINNENIENLHVNTIRKLLSNRLGATSSIETTPANPIIPKRPDLLSSFLSQHKVGSADKMHNIEPNININKPLQPLNLTLPNITSLGNKNQNNFNENNNNNIHYNNNNNNNNNELGVELRNDILRNNSKTNMMNNNKFYIQLLENVNLDDQSVFFELIDTLTQIRSENQLLKENIWERVDSLGSSLLHKSDYHSSGENKPNNLIYDSNLTNEELKKLLKDRQMYNKILEQTVEEYEKSLSNILDTLVRSNKEASEELLETIKTSEKVVEENADEMWDSWNEVAATMEVVASFDRAVVDTFKDL